MSYDEDFELTRYVWNHFQRLLTVFEWRVGSAIHGWAKAAVSKSPALADAVNQLWGKLGDPEIEQRLTMGQRHSAAGCEIGCWRNVGPKCSLTAVRGVNE